MANETEEWINNELKEFGKEIANFNDIDNVFRYYMVLKYAMAKNLPNLPEVIKWFKDNGFNGMMHGAALDGNANDMEQLQKNGFDIDVPNDNGDKPIHTAAGSGNIEVVKWLLDKNPKSIDCEGQVGQTPLHRAASNGEVEMMKYLKKRGADIEAIDNFGGTPMFSAAWSGKIESMKCLKELGAKLDVILGNGVTLIKIAHDAGHTEAEKWLRDNVRESTSSELRVGDKI